MPHRRSSRPRLVAVLATSVATLLLGHAAGAYEDATVAFTLQDERIAESSGLARSLHDDTLLWTHNDSGGDAAVFALSPDGSTRARLLLDGVDAFDWEDMASGPGPDGRPSLFLGDVGDNVENGPSRDHMLLHVVPEPDLADVPVGADVTAAAVTYELAWPTGFNDCETVLVDPATGDVYLVTKTYLGTSEVHRVVLPAVPDGRITTTPVAAISFLVPLPPDPTPSGPISYAGFGAATGGDISPDGTRVAVRTYEDLLEWTITDGDVAGAFLSAPERIDLPAAPQGEALAYAADGSLFASSEGVGTDVHVLAAEPTTTDPSPAPSPTATASPDPAPTSTPTPAPTSSPRPGLPATGGGLAAAALVGVGLARVARGRRGLGEDR